MAATVLGLLQRSAEDDGGGDGAEGGEEAELVQGAESEQARIEPPPSAREAPRTHMRAGANE